MLTIANLTPTRRPTPFKRTPLGKPGRHHIDPTNPLQWRMRDRAFQAVWAANR